MKDRHTISDPRETTTHDCSWEVDIYRKGVNEPIDSIIISDETLPPRKNKRGKIVWRLPVDQGTLPSFGTDERRRILNLFKERKKIRRKGGFSVATRESVSNEENTDISTISSHQKHLSQNVLEPSHNLSPTIFGKNDSFGNLNPMVECSGENKCKIFITSATPKTTFERSGFKNHRKVTKELEVRSSLMSSSDSITSNCILVVGENKEINNTVNLSLDINNKNSLSRPPGFDGITMPSNSPEFLFSLPSKENKTVTEIFTEDGSITSLHEGSLSQNKCLRNKEPIELSKKMRYISLQERCHQEHLHIASCLVLSQSKQEQLLNRSSLAVDAAKSFLNLYYPHVENGRSADLALYYTPHAQKSISIGGAHSVVTGKEDIIMQIASLAGTKFLVRGVVAQDAYDFFGANILVTGVAHTTSLGDNGSITPFAHSISLTPVKIPYDFQIHNDALSLMT